MTKGRYINIQLELRHTKDLSVNHYKPGAICDAVCVAAIINFTTYSRRLSYCSNVINGLYILYLRKNMN